MSTERLGYCYSENSYRHMIILIAILWTINNVISASNIVLFKMLNIDIRNFFGN